MAEPRFADDDDLPRTLRRERDAREREMREREMPSAVPDNAYGGSGAASYATPPGAGYDYGGAEPSGTVTRLQIPFVHLVLFFLKAAVAAIPALLLLTVLLWGMGQGLKAFFPNLLHFQIKIEPMNRP